VARGTVIGLLGGLAAGTALAVPGGGEALVTPLLLPAGAAAGGALLGGAVGLALQSRRGPREQSARRGRRRRREARRPGGAAARAPEPAAPEPPVLTALPAPAGEGGAAPPEGWYTDPLDATEQRWWDGEAWTDHTWRPRRRS
jgi:hypothetical protein